MANLTLRESLIGPSKIRTDRLYTEDGTEKGVELLRRICLSAILLGFSFGTFGAKAQDQTSTLELAAEQLHACIAQQTAAELPKQTTPRRFGIVLRAKCRTQEQQFKATLIRGLKDERALTPRMHHLINEMIASLREQSVANYAAVIKHHSTDWPK